MLPYILRVSAMKRFIKVGGAILLTQVPLCGVCIYRIRTSFQSSKKRLYTAKCCQSKANAFFRCEDFFIFLERVFSPFLSCLEKISHNILMKDL